MKCQLTGKTGKFIKAHIIPKSFFYRQSEDNNDNLLIDGREGQFPKRAPIGIYDKNILIEEGEEYFQELDSYGAKTLLKNRNLFLDFSTKNNTGKVLDKKHYDYKKLKMFFLSILWRASVSNKVGYECVNLGMKYETILKEIILNNDLKDDTFDIYLCRFDHPAFNKGTMILPIRTKMKGVNFYKIYLAEYIVCIKVDNKPIDKQIRFITLKKESDLYILNKDYSSSNEKKILEKMMSDKESVMPAWFIEKSQL